MSGRLRSVARRGLHALGLERRRHPSFVDAMRHHAIDTVFDVGANDGGFGAGIREAGYRGRIVSFEPIAAVHQRLQARAGADPRWEAHRLALGEREGPATIAVSQADVFSSLKPLNGYAAGLWPIAATARQETIEVARLDTWLARHPHHAASAYLKIDTQGFEMEVLRGAGDLLDRFRCVHAELALTPLYEGQQGWMEVIAWMADRGFSVMLAKENGVDWHAMRLLELDIVFERR